MALDVEPLERASFIRSACTERSRSVRLLRFAQAQVSAFEGLKPLVRLHDFLPQATKSQRGFLTSAGKLHLGLTRSVSDTGSERNTPDKSNVFEASE